MSCRIHEREIRIDLFPLFDSLTAEDKKELVDLLACDDAILEEVTNQLVTGYTSRCSSGDKAPGSPLWIAIETIARNANEIADDHIKRLTLELENLQSRIEILERSAFRAWDGRCIL
jgi:hypothetical protein